jgi:hypothetical protein
MSIDFETPLQNLTLFISYRHDDGSEAAQEVSKALEHYGARVWVDESSLSPGSSIYPTISAALNASDALVLIVTQQSLACFWVPLELGIALGLQKPVFPIVHEVKYNDIPTVVASLAGCTIHQIHTHLIPAIAKLRNEDLNPIASKTMYDEIRAAVTAIEAAELQDEMMDVLLDVFSFDKGCRRKSHIQLYEMPSDQRHKYLDIFDRLVDSKFAHLRGEAYYCLGQLRDISGDLRHDVFFFERGLWDPSDKVKSCCAKLMDKFVPLSQKTLSRLQQLKALGPGSKPWDSDRSGTVLWALCALAANDASLKQR